MQQEQPVFKSSNLPKSTARKAIKTLTLPLSIATLPVDTDLSVGYEGRLWHMWDLHLDLNLTMGACCDPLPRVGPRASAAPAPAIPPHGQELKERVLGAKLTGTPAGGINLPRAAPVAHRTLHSHELPSQVLDEKL